MNEKVIIAIVVVATLGVVGFAVWQQQKRLPALQARHPAISAEATPPPGLLGNNKEGQSSPLEFAALFKNLKPAKQECFREKFGETRLAQILANPAFSPSKEDNAVIGECLLAGAAFQDTPTTSAAP